MTYCAFLCIILPITVFEWHVFLINKKTSVFTYQIQATNFNMESLANLIQKQLTNV